MNSRFSTAVHILTLLASMPGERVTSAMIAASVGTNEVVIRRQLALLRKAGLVDSKGARGGGWVLSLRAREIRLSDVRRALGSEAQFKMHKNEPHPKCVIGQNVRESLGEAYDEANEALMRSLESWTVERLLRKVRKRASRSGLRH